MRQYEYNGEENRADAFSRDTDAKQIVFAKPVFTDFPLSIDHLPLNAIMNHPDFIDLISAQEFGIEHLTGRRVLLGIIVATAEAALDELEQLICGTAAKKHLAAACHPAEGQIQVEIGDQTFTLPDKLPASAQRELPNVPDGAAILSAAALTQWCVELPVRFYWPDEL